jgi:hypothetical protein
MSVETHECSITVNDLALELGEPLSAPDEAMVGEHSGQLIVAQLLDENGNPAQRMPGARFAAYPKPPERPGQNADRAAMALYEAAMQDHTAAVTTYIEAGRTKKLLPVPPIVGYLALSGENSGFFSVNGLNGTTTLVPFARDGQRYPYRIQTATIRDQMTE